MLYIVATPIGNLEDITYRAVRVLREVDVVLCEDTRVTRTLLAHYDITTPTRAVHQHTRDATLSRIVQELSDGADMALVTDAGTPGLSDPGNQLVAAAVAAGVTVTPVPGPSALTAAVSIAGVDPQRFAFLAYPPHKKGRQTFFRRVARFVTEEKLPVIYYDSVHRVAKNLTLLADTAPDAHIIIARELTKLHEEILRGTATDLAAHFAEHPDTLRGEFAVVVY